MVRKVDTGDSVTQALPTYDLYLRMLAMRKPQVSQQDQCVSQNEQSRGLLQRGHFLELDYNALIVALAPGNGNSLAHQEVAAKDLGVIAGDG